MNIFYVLWLTVIFVHNVDPFLFISEFIKNIFNDFFCLILKS